MLYRQLLFLFLMSLCSCKSRNYAVIFQKEGIPPFSVPLQEQSTESILRESRLDSLWKEISPTLQNKLIHRPLNDIFPDTAYAKLLSKSPELTAKPVYLGVTDGKIVGEVSLISSQEGRLHRYLKAYILLPMTTEELPEVVVQIGTWILE